MSTFSHFLLEKSTHFSQKVNFLQSFVVFQTFLTLSLSDMANRVQLSSPREAEQYILNMVRQQNNISLKKSIRASNQRAFWLSHVMSSLFVHFFT